MFLLLAACVHAAAQERAQAMFQARAFVHQYEAYGLCEHDLKACFSRVEDMAARYGSMG
jgi:hypothetical protein